MEETSEKRPQVEFDSSEDEPTKCGKDESSCCKSGCGDEKESCCCDDSTCEC